MKKLLLPIVGFAALLSLLSCDKNKTPTNCGVIPAKIIRYDCDRVIFQLLTNETIGDANWTDVQTGQNYSNVVYYKNTCAIAPFSNGGKPTLYVNLKKVTIDVPITNDCVQCEALSQNPPATQVDMIDISATLCNLSN